MTSHCSGAKEPSGPHWRLCSSHQLGPKRKTLFIVTAASGAMRARACACVYISAGPWRPALLLGLALQSAGGHTSLQHHLSAARRSDHPERIKLYLNKWRTEYKGRNRQDKMLRLVNSFSLFFTDKRAPTCSHCGRYPELLTSEPFIQSESRK